MTDDRGLAALRAALAEIERLRALILTVEADGSISRIAGGPLEEPVDTRMTMLPPAIVEAIINAAELLDMAGSTLGAENLRAALAAAKETR